MAYPDPIEERFTMAERRAWVALARASRLLLTLPAVHPADHVETVRDIHNLQNRLLARVAYPERDRA